MTHVPVPHDKRVHCHHDVPEVECTMCSYLAMEQAHQTLVDKYLEDQRESE